MTRRNRRHGQSLTSWALLIGLVAISVIVALQSFGFQLRDLLETAESRVSQVTNATAGGGAAAGSGGSGSTGGGNAGGGNNASGDAFEFSDRDDVATGSQVASETITLPSFSAPATVSLSGDPTAEARVDGGSWTSSPGQVQPGQTLQLRVTSDSQQDARKDVSVSLAGLSDTWSVTTDGFQVSCDIDPIGADQDTGTTTTEGDDTVLSSSSLGESIYMQGGNDTLKVDGHAPGNVGLGAGDDLLRIRDYVDAQIFGNGGNDDVVVAGSVLSNVYLADGDDSFTTCSDTTGTMDLGEGNNTLEVDGRIDGNLRAGDGDDSVRVSGDVLSGMTLGNGANDVLVMSGTQGISTGNGPDTIDVSGYVGGEVNTALGDDSVTLGNGAGFRINTSGGSDTVKSGANTQGIYLGDGLDELVQVDGTIDGELSATGGPARAEVTGNINAITSLGAGDDVLLVNGRTMKISLGTGANRAEIGDTVDGELVAQGGNDVIRVARSVNAQSSLGGGDDDMRVGINTRSVNLGSGNNRLEVGGDIDGALTVSAPSGNDTIRVAGAINSGSDTGAGADSVHALGQTMSFSLGGGNDVFRTATGVDGRLDAEGGNDRLDVDGYINNAATLGTGDDVLRAAGGTAGISTNAGTNTVQIGGAVDGQINGGNGNDTVDVVANVTAQTSMNDGDDVLDIGGGTMTVNLGAGNDVIQVGGTVDGALNANGGNDRIEIGGALNNQMTLGAGDDIAVVNGSFSGNIYGGAGTDILVLNGYTQSDWAGGLSSRVGGDVEHVKVSDGVARGDASAFSGDLLTHAVFDDGAPAAPAIQAPDADAGNLGSVDTTTVSFPSGTFR